MIWKPVPGHETMYEVSDEGIVRRIARGKRTFVGKLLKPMRCSNGYRRVKLFDGDGNHEARLLHSVVAAAFIGPRPHGAEINHKDGDKTNNDYRNLEYTTRLANAQHAVRHGLYRQGAGVTNSKLTDDMVREMRTLSTEGWSQRKLARKYGLAQPTVGTILRRVWWKHVA